MAKRLSLYYFFVMAIFCTWLHFCDQCIIASLILIYYFGTGKHGKYLYILHNIAQELIPYFTVFRNLTQIPSRRITKNAFKCTKNSFFLKTCTAKASAKILYFRLLVGMFKAVHYLITILQK